MKVSAPVSINVPVPDLTIPPIPDSKPVMSVLLEPLTVSVLPEEATFPAITRLPLPAVKDCDAPSVRDVETVWVLVELFAFPPDPIVSEFPEKL